MKKWTIRIFLCFLIGGMVLHLALPDREVSKAERRYLTQYHDGDRERYLADQFPFREQLRTVKSLWTYYVLNQKENNGVYLEKGVLAKPVLTDDGVFAQKMDDLRTRYFPDSEVVLGIIPDKAQYLSCPKGDYSAMADALSAALPWAQTVDLKPFLSIKDFYRTDSHWRQERLGKVAEQLSRALGCTVPPVSSYEARTLPGFYGVYSGQAALPLAPDTLTWLNSPVTDRAVVTGQELTGQQKVYDEEKFNNMDSYDLFLHGAQAILTVENPLAPQRELLVFRDSFASSLIPLLLPAYSRITLIDTRYVDSRYLAEFVDFHGQQVLLLYSEAVIRSASVLR